MCPVVREVILRREWRPLVLSLTLREQNRFRQSPAHEIGAFCRRSHCEYGLVEQPRDLARPKASCSAGGGRLLPAAELRDVPAHSFAGTVYGEPS